MVLKWRLIPDGATSILELTIEIEHLVKGTGSEAQREAEQVIAHVVHYLTDKPIQQVMERFEQERWLGDEERPDEPGRPR